MVSISITLLSVFINILESKKKVEKKVGRLWEAREAPPKSIPIESKIKKVWREAARASSLEGSLPCLP